MAALNSGIRDAMQEFMAGDEWASWLRLIKDAWAADPRVQQGWIRDCIVEAQRAVEESAENNATSDAQPLLDKLEQWRLDHALAVPEVCFSRLSPAGYRSNRCGSVSAVVTTAPTLQDLLQGSYSLVEYE